ncbi:RNA polymerase II-associated protein 3-like [Ruditapes philippinarum]|uniref:RNA polymerase II-associated protein 3-like n=1 Tax=Ruditapes philippinarum TaxID=129788 RepID=UPI00295B6D4B|nr:RNA polymerase II-associated protein 3-like [Ruditapes philippinarum]
MATISEQENKMLNLQLQMKQNNEDLKSFLGDLDNWEQEMKQIDSKLKSKKPSEEMKLPPVRNSLDKKKMKKKVKKRKDGSDSKPKRISSYDYRSWDKFDVDKACESNSDKSSDGEYETDEEWETERKKQAAVLEKDKGNEYFKKGDYANAIECYTKGIDYDPTNPLLPANRAMALLKQDKFGAAELDCSVALTLDPLYTKAYLRRASARLGLKKYTEAKLDFEKVLQLEPQNKKAKSDLELIEKELAKEKLVTHSDTAANPNLGIVKAISKAPSERSQKPLRRITIEEVGVDEVDIRSAVAKAEASQSQAKRDIVEKEGDSFMRFTANSPADITSLSVRNTSVNTDPCSESNSDKTKTICDKDLPNGDRNQPTAVTNSKTKDVSVNKSRQVGNVNYSGSNTSASSRGGQTSPRDNLIPVNSVQFQADYRRLKSDKQAFYQYFKKIPPSDYTKLFGQFLDADVLQTILLVIKRCYIPNGDNCWECLKNLATVKRFSMVAMFMSKKDKEVLTDIFTHLRDCGHHPETDINALALQYDLR